MYFEVQWPKIEFSGVKSIKINADTQDFTVEFF